jgi:hypothetical protein
MTPPGRSPGDEPAGDPVDSSTPLPVADATGRGAERREPEAIFVVGVPRSGTTLMRMILGKHSRIAIAGESHYLGHRLPKRGVRQDLRRAGDLRSDEAVRRLVARLYADEVRRGSWRRAGGQFWRWLVRRVPREELEQRVLAGERSERGVFTAVLRSYSDRMHKPIFGEKTPAHIRWADTLLEWYPEGRVIHMVRDPRAVYRSELKRRVERPESFPYRALVGVRVLMRSFVLLEVVEAWANAVDRHRSLSRRYPDRYTVVRFEDLVRAPEQEVERVAAFLGVAPEPAMLKQEVVSWGDRLGESGFDAGAADRWRMSITRGEMRWLGWLLGRRIEEMGYTRS